MSLNLEENIAGKNLALLAKQELVKFASRSIYLDFAMSISAMCLRRVLFAKLGEMPQNDRFNL